MPDDHKQSSYRLRTGPIASNLLDRLDEQTSNSLDAEIQRLLTTQDRASTLEEERVALIQTVTQLSSQVGMMASALMSTSTSVDKVTDLIDHRTREIQKLMLHISAMVGTTFTDGAERERLHTRINDVFLDLAKQMESLSNLVKGQQKERQRMVQNAVGRAEEERLTIADKVAPELDARAPLSRGKER